MKTFLIAMFCLAGGFLLGRAPSQKTVATDEPVNAVLAMPEEISLAVPTPNGSERRRLKVIASNTETDVQGPTNDAEYQIVLWFPGPDKQRSKYYRAVPINTERP